MTRAKMASNRSPNWAFCERFVVPDYDTDGDYLVRIRLVQTPWFGVFLHRFDMPDPRPTLHDHPWPFLAIVLRGGYDEQRRDTHDLRPGDFMTEKAELCPFCYSRRHRVTRLNLMPLHHLHYIESLHRTPTWTLMLVGRRRRAWGYLDRDGTWTAFNEHPHNEAFLAAMARREGRS